MLSPQLHVDPSSFRALQKYHALGSSFLSNWNEWLLGSHTTDGVAFCWLRPWPRLRLRLLRLNILRSLPSLLRFDWSSKFFEEEPYFVNSRNSGMQNNINLHLVASTYRALRSSSDQCLYVHHPPVKSLSGRFTVVFLSPLLGIRSPYMKCNTMPNAWVKNHRRILDLLFLP